MRRDWHWPSRLRAISPRSLSKERGFIRGDKLEKIIPGGSTRSDRLQIDRNLENRYILRKNEAYHGILL